MPRLRPYPISLPNPKIQATRHLWSKSQIQNGNQIENGSAVSSQSASPTSPLSKSTPNCLLRASFRNSLSSNRTWALAFRLPSQVLKKDVPYRKIIETPFSTKPLKMLPGFPVPIPGTVFLTAAPIFPATFDYDILKIGR